VLTLSALSDRMGRAKFLQSGLLIFGLASLGAMFSTAPIHLIVVRAIMGVAAAIIVPSTLSITTHVFPSEERGRAIGLCAGLAGFGTALGPIIAGTMLEHLDWHWLFSINIVTAALALILSVFLITESRDAHPRRVDIPGNALFLVGMMSLIYGLNSASTYGWGDSIVLGPIIGSLVLMAFFVLWERRTAEPLLDMSFFKRVRFSISLVFLTLFTFGYVGIMYLVTFYMQFVKGYGAFQTGVRYAPLAIGFLTGAVISARLVERLGIRIVTLMSFLGAAVILVFVAFFRVDTPFWHFGPVLFFVGLFCGGIASPASNMLMGSLPVAKAGVSSGMQTIGNFLPASISVAAMGSLLTSVYSNHFLKAAESIQGIPAGLLDKASDSVGAAVRIAGSGQIPPETATPLTEAARQSFMDGWQIVAIVLCVLFVVGAAICLLIMPGRLDEHKDTAIKEA
jgi:DHA2 family multidrug resistance protein-like MFS transporter